MELETGTVAQAGWVRMVRRFLLASAMTIAVAAALGACGDEDGGGGEATEDTEPAAEEVPENEAPEDTASEDSADTTTDDSSSGPSSDPGDDTVSASGECGIDVDTEEATLTDSTPMTRIDSASIHTGGDLVRVEMPTDFYLAEGERWDERFTAEGDFSTMQFRVLIGPEAGDPQWGVRFNFSRFVQPGDERTTFYDLSTGFEDNPPAGIIAAPPVLLGDAMGLEVGQVRVPEDWTAHRVEFFRMAGPAGEPSTGCLVTVDRDDALDRIFDALVDNSQEPPQPGRLTIEIDYGDN